jgi:putative transcriptional regulator
MKLGRSLLIATSTWFCFVGAVASVPCLAADELQPGTLLIAPREPADQSFSQVVILLVRQDQSGTMGVILNRPIDVPVNRVLKREKGARHLTQSVYSGGPVEQAGLLVLMRLDKQDDDAPTIVGDTRLIASEEQLKIALQSHPSEKNFRLYVGYTGWAPGQLEHEMDLDVWKVLPANQDSIFDPDPSTLWKRLIERIELRFALLLRGPGS